METDLGIDNLEQNQRDLLAAIVDIQKDDGTFDSHALKSHTLTSKQSKATFSRTLAHSRIKDTLPRDQASDAVLIY